MLVEYALLLTFFAVPVCGGLTMAALEMLKGYQDTRSDILRPLP